MWMVQWFADLLGGSAGATRNAALALEHHRTGLAEVDSVVARLQSHVQAVTPAA